MKQLRKIADDRGVTYTEREGGRHTVVTIAGQNIAVPRHGDVAERLARKILRDAEEA